MVVIWNDKKFACPQCTKGHRTNACAHLKRTLTELRVPGRPLSQCGSCRVKRQTGQGHVHHKCKCGSEAPKNHKEYYKLVFSENLELVFTNTSNSVNIAILQVQVQQNTALELKVQKGKEDAVITPLIPQSLLVIREPLPQDHNENNNNPCRCHFGGECICSELPQERKKKKPASDANASGAGSCSCSSGCGCSSNVGGCQCGNNSTGAGTSTNGASSGGCCSTAGPSGKDSTAGTSTNGASGCCSTAGTSNSTSVDQPKTCCSTASSSTPNPPQKSCCSPAIPSTSNPPQKSCCS